VSRRYLSAHVLSCRLGTTGEGSVMDLEHTPSPMEIATSANTKQTSHMARGYAQDESEEVHKLNFYLCKIVPSKTGSACPVWDN
jgi:hypothetical protein